jgi:hypothetical protein
MKRDSRTVLFVACISWMTWIVLTGTDHFLALFNALEVQALTDGFKMVYWNYFEFQRVHLHPPLTALLLFAWATINPGEVWIRFFPALCGLFTLLLFAVRLKSRHSVWTVIVATLYLTFTLGFNELHATLLNYGWPVLLGMGLVVAHDKYLRTKANMDLAGFAALSVLACFSEYASLLLLVPLWLNLLTSTRHLYPLQFRAIWITGTAWALPLAVWLLNHWVKIDPGTSEYLDASALLTVNGTNTFFEGNAKLLHSLFPFEFSESWAIGIVTAAVVGGLWGRLQSLALFAQCYALTLMASLLVHYPWNTFRHRYSLWLLGMFVLVDGLTSLCPRIPVPWSRFSHTPLPRPLAISMLAVCGLSLLLAFHYREDKGYRDMASFAKWASRWNQVVRNSPVLFTDGSTVERVHWYAARRPEFSLLNVVPTSGLKASEAVAVPNAARPWTLYDPTVCSSLKKWVRQNSSGRWAVAALKLHANDGKELLRCIANDPTLKRSRKWFTDAGWIVESSVGN